MLPYIPYMDPMGNGSHDSLMILSLFVNQGISTMSAGPLGRATDLHVHGHVATGVQLGGPRTGESASW